MISLKFRVFLSFFCGLVTMTFGQTENSMGKNNLTYDYTFYQGQWAAGGEILAQGVVLGYSRYFTPRLFGEFSYGLMNFKGRNSYFYLDDDEMDFINMRTFTIGAGYDLFQSKHFVFSTVLSYLRQSNEQLLLEYGSPDSGTYVRETGRAKDATLRIQFKPRIFVGEHFQIIPSYSYGFGLGKYKSDWLSLGLGYSF
ncbi:hypothetical protein SAMN04488519_10498 [Algoriphagus ornithinivorans]|uniref:Outer membrane protein beta-barrel domain-containing protein n=2 Tax=Algoriphagus ornithinivorans TaxID=226506 RepID=A0A1I5EWB9_9BACT|nr:hypothetical protein SAMN04488519_10498 [Algoriphagus ornithinivorans]